MSQSLKVALVAGGALCGTLVCAPAGYADAGAGYSTSDASADTDDTGLLVQVSTAHDQAPAAAGTSNTEPAPVPSCGLQVFDGMLLPGSSGDAGGYWVVDTCADPNDLSAIRWVPASPGGPASAASVAATALARASWPAIATQLNPPPARLLVHFPIWLHLRSGWRAVTATAAVAGVSATVTARPEWVRWDMGDGRSVVCRSAGTAYDPSRSWSENVARRDCGYTYTRSSAGSPDEQFAVTVTVHYAVTWATNGVAGGGSLGGVDRATTFRVAVGQLQALDD